MLKKIIFIIPSVRHGGAELFLLRLCSSISDLYTIRVIVIGKREGLYRKFEKINLKMYYLGIEKKYLFLKAIIQIRSIFINEKPDVIHSFLYISDVISGIASLGLRIKLRVWSLRGTKLSNGTHLHKFLIQGFAALLARFIPDIIIACSNQALDFHVKIGYPRKKIRVIWNFLPSWVYEVSSTSIFLTKQNPHTFKIGIAARYEEGKGHLALIDCILKFLENKLNVNLIVKFAGKNCGPGGKLSSDILENFNLQELIKKKRVSIEFSGLIDGAKLKDWYRDIDLYFMASSALEAFPNSLAEAIAIGVPALANPVGAASDFLPKARISSNKTSEEMYLLLNRFYGESVSKRTKISQNYKKRIIHSCRNDLILSKYLGLWKIN
jgi:glycosyltransferase involved in cell wall biosynthesis